MFGWLRGRRQDAPSQSDQPPISYNDLRGLFEALNRPNPQPCDHSYRESIAYLLSHGLAVEPTLAWLKAHGGFCDCEVIFSVSDEWGEIVGFDPEQEIA